MTPARIAVAVYGACCVLAACARREPARTDSETAALLGVAGPAGPTTSVSGSEIASGSRWTGPYPHVTEGTCEGESCVAEFRAVACRDVLLRAVPADTARATLALRAGDTVQVRTDLHLLAPGIVVLRRDYVVDSEQDETGTEVPANDTLRLAAGDTLLLLQYGELGHWNTAWRGRVYYVNEFWAGPADGQLGGAMLERDSSIAVARSQPSIERWWRATRHDGRVGWWLDDESTTLLSLSQAEHWGERCR